ncbi:hypothetical protein QNH20_14000 [Neobacillus sp. WH10]|uniref:hypothetical protein n=1 Tax=Neobacillus sp. WH10 TaxID=3047873 RepID=UPI0024C11774|nr:hypothetical protein [Neobacillus sp. WH10]WHY75263.1 hypothetical protein QNH20_14000 [Neobacillus sp. WH10]
MESGIIEINYGQSDFIPVIAICFYDEDTGVDYILDTIILGEFSPTKESYVIGEFDLSRIKNNTEADTVMKLLIEKAKEIEIQVVAKAKEFAQEISERAGIPVEVIPRLQGKPEVYTEFDHNMWQASHILEGIDEDY